MDIENLETFIEVAESRSFSRSAKALCLTQPAVSKRIASLESALSTKLFDRIGRTVHLTEAGRILLPSAKQIRSELSRIEDVICNIGSTVNGRLTLSTTEFIATCQLPAILRSYREAYPDVKIDLQFSAAEDVLTGVQEHLYDLALCPLTPSMKQKMSARVNCTDVWSNQLVIAAAHNDPLTSATGLTIANLVENPAILPPEKTFIRNMIDAELKSRDLATNVSLEASDYSTIRSMTAAGLGWTCLPDFQIDSSLTRLDVADFNLSYTVAVIYRKDLTLSRAAKMFIEALPTIR